MLLFIGDSKEKARHSIEALRSNMLEHQKDAIFDHVDQVMQQVEYRHTQTVSELEKQAQQRVSEAHQIASSIYQNNQDKSKAEITAMISDALKPIRFFNGRGYFFIFQMDGVNVMHALKPHIEGSSGWNTVDIKGTFILRDHIKLIEKNGGEAFYRWWYQKPGFPASQEFEKIGYGQAFTPYNWFIGTGEYVADVEQDIKAELIALLADFQAFQEDKVFIFNKQGDILVHQDPDLVGQNVYQLDTDLAQAWRGLDQRDFTQGAFVESVDSQTLAVTNIGYLKEFEPWDWYVGATFPIAQVNAYIADQQAALADKQQQHLVRLIAFSIASALLMIGVSFLASHIIVKRFDKFQRRIKDDFERLESTNNQMQYMALHDPLTGLSNRSALLDQIGLGIAQSKANQQGLAVVFLDLDDFKKVNDLYGHSLGDKLLKSLSRKFKAVLGTNDTVARFGGDEFVFCFPNLRDRQHTLHKIMAVKKLFEESLIIDDKLLTTDCSIGVSMYPYDSDDPETLISNADMVLYRSKLDKKGSVLFFDSQINDQIKQEYHIEQELKHALGRGELSVVYQPQICTEKSKVVGVEALVRWNSASLGFIPPDRFIPLAEKSGLIYDIGLFVYRRACEDIFHLGSKDLHVSINVSPKQLIQDGFIDDIIAISGDVGIETERVILEVTENMFIHDPERVTPLIESLQGYGFGISLDDFGTGYSSLSHLNQFSIDELKIDKSFIAHITDNANSNALVKAILAIGKAYNIKVVAEGIETIEQYQMLSSYGCKCVQGYYLSKPLPIDVLAKWLNQELVAIE